MSIAIITPQKLADFCREGTKIEHIDVRTPVGFREVHVEVARNVPLDQLDPAGLMHLAVGVYRCRAALLRNHGYLRDGHGSGTNAVEPMRINHTLVLYSLMF